MKMFFRRVLILMGILMMTIFSTADGNEADEFSVRRIGQMICYQSNFFEVSAPEDGTFSVTVYDEDHIYRIIRETVCRGINLVEWDGCAYNEEKLLTKYYSFDFRLQGASGNEYFFQFRSPVVDHAQHLQFVLPSGDTVYTDEKEEWFVEVKTILGGTLNFRMIPEDSTQETVCYQKSLHIGRVDRFTFGQITGKKPPEPGDYEMQIYESSRPSESVNFMLHVKQGTGERMTVVTTGDIMPGRNATDAEIWDAMMCPSVVVDIDYLQHQNVYSEADSKSAVLGTLHGQTQCLSVLSVEDSWAKIGAWNHEEGTYTEGWVPYQKLKTVQPNTEYGLLLDKQKQTISVFYQGERIEELLVSTGRMEKNKTDQETSAGCFLTGFHRVDFSMQGNRYDFVIQYDGGNLLHQIPYTSDGRKDFTMGRAYLGSKASHGCVRIQDEPGDAYGINAYWIWTHIPYHTKLIILDDPEERAEEMAILTGNIMTENPMNDNSTETAGNEETITLTFGGDVIPGWSDEYYGIPGMFSSFFEQFGSEYMLSGLVDYFRQDDLTCVSLECVLKENRYNEDYLKNVRYRGLPEYAELFAKGSVELVCFDNEHVYDYGEDGYESTVKNIEKHAAWIGKDHVQVISVKGHLFGFGTCSEQEYLQDPHVISKDILELKEKGCEYIIYQCHWGNENDTGHGKLQEAMARACERAGADLVIGHHPNQIQGIGKIHSMPVIYSLGKLLPCGSSRMKKFDTILIRAIFYPQKKDKTPQIIIVPVCSDISVSGNISGYHPVPADEESKTRILQQIQADTPFDITAFSE